MEQKLPGARLTLEAVQVGSESLQAQLQSTRMDKKTAAVTADYTHDQLPAQTDER